MKPSFSAMSHTPAHKGLAHALSVTRRAGHAPTRQELLNFSAGPCSGLRDANAMTITRVTRFEAAHL